MKFAHLGDCHLGSWRQPELQELNFLSFQNAIDKAIKARVEFVLIAGDLFDSAYPPIEILKRTFAEFRKLKEADIKVFMIAGSHDFSVSGKTFLDVLEKGGFCEICKYEENGVVINLLPIKYKSFEIYGYPGKKSGMEIEDLRKIILPKDNGNFRILMLHTSIKEAVGDLPIESISMKSFPKADYYALGHLHINFSEKLNEKPIIYSGPIFPNSFQELDDLCYGRFYLVTVEGYVEPKRQDIILKEVVTFKINIQNTLTATQQILDELEKHDLNDKIILMKLFGEIKKGTNADIDYVKIEEYLKSKKIYSFLRNTSKLVSAEEQIDIKISEQDVNKIEETLIKEYELKNPDKFNNLIVPLMHSLELQKQEDEKSAIYETRLFSELNKIFGLDLK